MIKNFTSWLVAAVLLTAIVAAYSVNRRQRVEYENRTTAIAVEYETVESLASAQGISCSRALVDLKAQGVSAIVLSESYLGDLVSAGRASIVTVSPGGSVPASTGLVLNDARQLARVQRGLRIRFGELAGDLVPRGNVLSLPAVSPLILRQTAIGLDPDQVALVTSARLRLEIIGRAVNPVGIAPQAIRATLKWMRESGADVFLPQGDQVIGRRDNLETTTTALAEFGIRYASPEFTKIGGDEEVIDAHPENVIRLHTAQTAELDRLDYAGAVDRFVKAARERNMRILLIRPYTFGADQPLAQFAKFVKDIGDGLSVRGIPLGHPKGFEDPAVPRPVFVLLGLLVSGCTAIVVRELFSHRRVWIPIVAVLVLLGFACWIKAGRQVVALIASGAFPVLGFLTMDRMTRGEEGGSLATGHWPSFLRPLPGFIVISLLSVLGGLCVAGLLNGLPYLVKADEFRGIKISIFLPILVVGWVFSARLLDWRQALRSPITWGAAALGAIVLSALAFMLARTGNDSAVGASGGELELRGFLDAALYVRPRTKEFLVGHPILYIGIGLLMIQTFPRRLDMPDAPWIVLALMVGAIGQTSVVNTLCHLHIPLVLSLARIFIGLGLGCIIGIVLWAAVGPALAKRTV